MVNEGTAVNSKRVYVDGDLYRRVVFNGTSKVVYDGNQKTNVVLAINVENGEANVQNSMENEISLDLDGKVASISNNHISGTVLKRN